MESKKIWQNRWKPCDKGIKRGGQSEIIKVTDGHVTGALKLLTDGNDDSERRIRVAKEVAALKKVAGSGVPAVLDDNAEQFENKDVQIYIVEQWIDGKDLEQSIKKPIDLDRALDITREIALILDRCHSLQVIHRDIKPANIMLQADGHVSLIDFGIARIDVDGIDTHTEASVELGNRFLRLPEMTAGQERKDHRSDIACAVGVLFFLLTRTFPRSLGLGDAGLRPHEEHFKAFPDATRSDPRFAGHLRWLFNVGFQYIPNFRIQSAKELIEMIDEMNAPKSTDPTIISKERLKRFDAMMGGGEYRQRRDLMKSLMDVALAFEERIRLLCAQRGITFKPTASNREAANAVRAPFKIEDTASGINERGSYHFKLDDNDSTKVIATSTLNGRHAKFFHGPIVNIDRLREASEEHALHLLGELVERVVNKRQLEGDVFEY